VTLFLTHLHTSAESTQSLLDNLLLWARARGGTLNVKSSQFSLNDVVETVLTGLTSQAEAKDVTLEVSATAEDHVCGDVHLTQTILRNLVANAIKFTPSGGKVSIAARTDVTSGRFELEVVDTGIGMDEKRLAAVLDPERASTRPGTAGEAGSGLGLTLVRELTARLGGDLRAQSEVDRGTRITVSLPSGSELT
jgi:signal transduction histidine kinase